MGIESADPMESVYLFHKSLYVQHIDAVVTNLNIAIRNLGADPANFADRVGLADEAFRNGDFIGAKIEYEAALAIKDDAEVRRRLNLVSSAR